MKALLKERGLVEQEKAAVHCENAGLKAKNPERGYGLRGCWRTEKEHRTPQKPTDRKTVFFLTQRIELAGIEELLNKQRKAHDKEPLKHWEKNSGKKPYKGVEKSPKFLRSGSFL